MSDMSLAQRIALLTQEEREHVMRGMEQDKLAYDWSFWARPSQILPQDDESWHLALYIAGRGSGKTRAGSEWVRDVAKRHPGCRIGLVARTSADARDVLVEGDSGVLAVCAPEERPEYEPSKRRLTWPNGSTATLFTADAPDQLRGPQFNYTLCDEIATWPTTPDASGLTAWDNVQIATRLGARPKIVAMTTPKRTPVMRDLLKRAETDDGIVLRRGRTVDNAGNLSAAYIDTIMGLYSGTRLAKQELEGEMLDAVDGALWSPDNLDLNRVNQAPPVPMVIVVGVDPSVADQPRDECGIVVVGATMENDLFRRHAYVLEDASVLGSPNIWAAKVVEVARRYGAPIVAEVNQGGSLIRSALQNIDPTMKVLDVRARYGKVTRAEPITLAYDQNRVHHIGYHPDLESQLISWVPEETRKSPDRLDALVWACTSLLVAPPPGLWTSNIRAHSSSQIRISSPKVSSRRTNRVRNVDVGLRPKRR